MPRISTRSPSARVQLMKRKQITAPAARAASMSSRHNRSTSSFGNRSIKNSIESMMIRAGFSACVAAMIASRMFSRLEMSSMWYRSGLGRRSWEDVASTKTSFAGSTDPNRFISPRASWGARKKSTYMERSPAFTPWTAKFSPKIRFSVGLSLNRRSVEGRGNPPWRRSSRTGIPVLACAVGARTGAAIIGSPRSQATGGTDARRRRPGSLACDGRGSPLHRVRVPHLHDAVDQGPEEVHRHRFVDSLVDRVQDETEVRLRPRGDDLEELRDRLGRVVKEQGGDRVEVDPDRRAELLRGLAHRHADPLEVAEARDEERLLARGRFGSVRRGRAVAVDEHERLALVRSQVEVERLRPRADLVRRHVEGHEHDALAES